MQIVAQGWLVYRLTDSPLMLGLVNVVALLPVVPLSLLAGVIRWGVQRIHREGQPVIMYVHPWELDLDQPRTRVTPRERFTHYHGRASLEAKLHRLLQEFQFAPLKDLLATIRDGCT